MVVSVFEKTDCSLLERLLESLGQVMKLPSFDLWVIFDGPVVNELRTLVAKYDEALVLELENNVGLGGALYHWSQTCGDCYRYLYRIDSDDCYVSGRIEVQAKILGLNPDVAVTSGSVCYATSKRTIIRQVPEFPKIGFCSVLRSPVNHPAAAIRVEALVDVGGFPTLRTGQDLVLWHRLMKRGWRIQNHPEIATTSDLDRLFWSRRGVRAFLSDLRAYKALMSEHLVPRYIVVPIMMPRFLIACMVSISRLVLEGTGLAKLRSKAS